MFVTKTDEIFSYIKENPNFSILLAETFQIETLLIQNLKRDDVVYLSLRNIVLKEEFRGTNFLRHLMSALEETKRPILIDDIKNERLFKFFENRQYEHYSYFKNDEKIKCMRRV